MGFAYAGLEAEELKKGRKAERERQRVRLGEQVRRLQPATAPPAEERPEVKGKVEPPQPVPQPGSVREEVIEEKKAVVVYQAPSGYVRPVKEEKTLYVWMEPSLDILKVRLEGSSAVVYAVNKTDYRYGFYVEWSNAPYEVMNVFVNPGETKDLLKLGRSGDVRLYYTRTSGKCPHLPLKLYCWSTIYDVASGQRLPECFVECGFIDIKLAW